MNHKETFEAFFDDIHMKDVTEYEDDLGGVIKKLNQHYYDSNDGIQSSDSWFRWPRYGSRWMQRS